MLIQKTLTLLRFEGKQAVFQLESGHELKLPKDDFPKDLQPGEEFVLKILTAREGRLEQDELARTLLNQILANDTPQKGTT